MDKYNLIERNKKFVLNVIKFCETLPNTQTFNIISKQLIRCSTSIGANYRAACRGKSMADFINKLKIVEEETDESIYFLDLINELNGIKDAKVEVLIKEGHELLSIFVASINTAKKRNLNSKIIKS